MSFTSFEKFLATSSNIFSVPFFSLFSFCNSNYPYIRPCALLHTSEALFMLSISFLSSSIFKFTGIPLSYLFYSSIHWHALSGSLISGIPPVALQWSSVPNAPSSKSLFQTHRLSTEVLTLPAHIMITRINWCWSLAVTSSKMWFLLLLFYLF